MDFQIIVNVVVLIGGFCVALNNISNFFGKPIKFFKKRTAAEFEEKFLENLEKYLPKMLEERELKTRDKYLADRQKYLREIQKEVLNSIQSELKSVNSIDGKIEALTIGTRDVLREKIMTIYYRGRTSKTIVFHDKEALDQYYKDYKGIGGNSYIDKYYARMINWKVIDDDEYQE